MAEGYARIVGTGEWEVYSAGLKPAQINPYAIKVLKEIGIDISEQKSKDIDYNLLSQMHIIVTLCDNAKELCPVTPPGIDTLHWSLPDPSGFTGTEKEIMRGFRFIRDEIRDRIESLLQVMRTGSKISK